MRLKYRGIFVIFTLMLQGCFEDNLNRMINKPTYDFEGVYENLYTQDLLLFKDAKVTISKVGAPDVIKSFKVEDNYLIITMRNSSLEKREDIVMRIHGDNEALTCSICAKYQLSSVWQRRLE
ncbi:hypothetical protein MHN79_03045 [Vibrio sp. Of14-4]|uniref:Lipoprotein n=2 Tax=Vibrio tetraodonis TaxID=2231647 RepID=A0A6L8LUU5_9VIBR|nr:MULTISPECIES: hypothetical protein [Vibrio]MCG7488458.1 hypothetical protein [Vibrio sp. Of14-4]MYM59253.1 hypothetical protein [Vibrio tetraodonis subsp. pristinus]